jgi:hypothetical protein
MAWSTDRPDQLSTTARGYGAEHQAARRAWQDVIGAQGWPCARQCGKIIRAGEVWHLDHNDDRTAYLGPSCGPCNLKAAGRAGRAARPSVRRRTPPPAGLIER